MAENPNVAALRNQVEICRRSGSPLTAEVLEAAIAVLDESTATGARVLGWRGEAFADALPLRFTGGIHAIARAGPQSALAAYYRDRNGDLSTILRDVIARHDRFLHDWLDSPPQTNEVGRSGVLMTGLLIVAHETGIGKIELLELGSSAGLNLNLDRYGYDLGGTRAGDPASAVQLKPDWTGPPPPAERIEVVTRRGVDIAPLDAADPTTAERLMAFVWADQAERLKRLGAALEIAKAYPPTIDRGDAADWLEVQLAQPRTPGVARIVMHSVAFPYFPPQTQARVRAAIARAGAEATTDTPLAWVTMEGAPGDHMLRVTIWPGGAKRKLADTHPHGTWMRWRS